MAGEINYPGIKQRCTGQRAVRGSSTIKIGNAQKHTQYNVIVHGTPNSLLEGEPWGGVWLDCMPIKQYGIAYEQKKSGMANVTPATPLLPPLYVVFATDIFTAAKQY